MHVLVLLPRRERVIQPQKRTGGESGGRVNYEPSVHSLQISLYAGERVMHHRKDQDDEVIHAVEPRVVHEPRTEQPEREPRLQAERKNDDR